MKNNIKSFLVTLLIFLSIGGCSDKEFVMGELTAPSDIVVNTEVVGQDATHPNGDGSGDVKISITGKNALSYKIDYDANDAVALVFLPSGAITRKYTKEGVNTYRLTVVAYGRGGTATTVAKEVTVRSDFAVDPAIATNLTGGTSKTWVVEKDVSGHFGVGPWENSSTPEWWSAPPNDKAGACCSCFYTAKFTFTKVPATNTYTIEVQSPTGVFTKTGALTTLPGIPASGGEGCYDYSGGTSAFSFMRSGSNVSNTSSTKTSILLGGNDTYIGYGSLQKEYEILSISATNMYLRVQGTETGNAWYLKMKAE